MQLADRLRGLEELEPCSATAIQVNASTRSIRIMRGFLLAKEAELARRSTELHSTGDGHTADKVLQNGSKVSQREAERTTKRAAALGRSDAMSKELADGRITAEHADALADAAGRMIGDDQRAALFDKDDEFAIAATSRTPAPKVPRLSLAVKPTPRTGSSTSLRSSATSTTRWT